MPKKFLVTGGCGFIGSAVIRYLIKQTDHVVLNVDKLTYAGNLNSVASAASSERYNFLHIDICNKSAIENAVTDFQPDVVMHLAAESHVDRSIYASADFIETNIIGTYQLLEATRAYWYTLSPKQKSLFRFHHVSTDEVYGDLESTDALFTEETPYSPSSPYSASKASSDHLVRAWHRTYGLPVVITNCSNNYGPFHFPEKLIPHMIINALMGRKLPIYGKGNQIRDWLYVEDHARALILVALEAKSGHTYNIGGHNEKKNFDVVESICDLLEEFKPNKPPHIHYYKDLITFVDDRPGHDLRYAIDAQKIFTNLGWKPEETFESGLRKTVFWYLNNKEWWIPILDNRLNAENQPLRIDK